MVVESSAEGGTEHRTASSDGTERRVESGEGGDRKTDVDPGVMAGSGHVVGRDKEER